MTSDIPTEENEFPENPQPIAGPELNVADLQNKTRDELIAIAESMQLENGKAPSTLREDEILNLVLHGYAQSYGYQLASGVMDLMSDGYGFLRQNGRRPGSNLHQHQAYGRHPRRTTEALWHRIVCPTWRHGPEQERADTQRIS